MIVGDQDPESDEYTIKNMDTGDQTTVPADGFSGNLERPTYDDFE